MHINTHVHIWSYPETSPFTDLFLGLSFILILLNLLLVLNAYSFLSVASSGTGIGKSELQRDFDEVRWGCSVLYN